MPSLASSQNLLIDLRKTIPPLLVIFTFLVSLLLPAQAENNPPSFTAKAISQAVIHADIAKLKRYLQSKQWHDSLYEEARSYNNLRPLEVTLIENNDNPQGLAVFKLLQEKALIDSAQRVSMPIGEQEETIVEEKINQAIKKQHQNEIAKLDQAIAALAAEQKELEKQIAKQDQANQKKAEQCMEKHRIYDEKEAALNKKLQAILDKVNQEKKAAINQANAAVVANKEKYHRRQAQYQARQVEGFCQDDDKACQAETAKLGQWLQDNKQLAHATESIFFEENIHSNAQVKAAQKAADLQAPSCNRYPHKTVPVDVQMRVNAINMESYELSQQRNNYPAPSYMYGTHVEKSLLRLAEEVNNKSLISYLRGQAQPDDGLHFVIYAADELIYSE